MALTRAIDDHAISAWRTGRGIGGLFSQRGHEAISVGIGMSLAPQDVVAPMHRDLGTYLVRGMAPERIYGNFLGREIGPSSGRDANMHGMGDLSLGIIGFISHLPQSVPVSLGVAMSFRYRAENRVAVTTIGDGGTTAGAFWESINMAGLWAAPLVIVIENNQYAYSTPLHQQTANPEIAEKVVVHGVQSEVVDGNDFDQVFMAIVGAIENARSGLGPTVIEAKTMRMHGHAIHDGADYVPRELLERWEERDPLNLMRRRLLLSGEADEAQLSELDRECKERAVSAFALAEDSPIPDPSTLGERVYA